jgi:chaperonin GroEL (HSP60 family)
MAKALTLRNMTDEPTDIMKAGIVDATKVVLQVVKNAFSVAGALLTTGAVVTTEDVNVEAPLKHLLARIAKPKQAPSLLSPEQEAELKSCQDKLNKPPSQRLKAA